MEKCKIEYFRIMNFKGATFESFRSYENFNNYMNKLRKEVNKLIKEMNKLKNRDDSYFEIKLIKFSGTSKKCPPSPLIESGFYSFCAYTRNL